MPLQPLIDAINFRGIVEGLTHDFYRYPARFSPRFARAAIELFSRPGDTVLDPFSGGATTLVEAAALGRNAVGADVSELAVFLARVKTTEVGDRGLDRLLDWATTTAPGLSPGKPVVRHTSWKHAGYQTNLPWRFRKIAEQALNATARLPDSVRPIARCVVLRTVQWAVDTKKHFPTAADFRDRLVMHAVSAVQGLRQFRDQVRLNAPGGRVPRVEVYNEPADKIGSLTSPLLTEASARLVVTSPPYPGVHVLYHRWQIGGGKESPAPFWIADCRDGQGCAYYTFGDRRGQQKDPEQYFARLTQAFAGVRGAIAAGAPVVQLLGFHNPDEHLPSYLDAMSRAGFEQEELLTDQGGIWRAVPNRKWYTWLKDSTRQTREVMLVHRKVSVIPPPSSSSASSQPG
jgi:hypothetical protein